MARKPNVLLLFNDHQAYYRHGWDGGVRPQRPHHERLAAEGVRFDRAYSPCPLCTPARRSLMTGLLAHNHGFLTLGIEPDEPPGESVYRRMAAAGYRLSYFGKWHTGPGIAADEGCAGFSMPGYGNPYLAPEYKEYVRSRGLDEASFDVKYVVHEGDEERKPPLGPGYRCPWKNFTPHISGVLEQDDDAHECNFVANLAIDELRRIAADEARSPFFMSVHFWGPHMPYLASQRFVDLYDPATIQPYGSFEDDLGGKPRVYRTEFNKPMSRDGRLVVPNPVPWDEWRTILRHCYAQISMVDDAGGRILDALAELGLSDDTLVIWTTDHGDALASHGGHYDKNAYLTEEVLRVPMAMRLPGQIPAGRVSSDLVSLIDIPATILDAAGTSFERPVDGASLLGLASGQPARAWRQDVMCETFGHHGERVVGRSLVTERYKYNAYRYLDADAVESELYDLRDDPYELRNLRSSANHTDVEADMIRRLRGWQERTRDVAPIAASLACAES